MSTGMDWTSTSEVFQARGFSPGGDPASSKSSSGTQQKPSSESSQPSGKSQAQGPGGRAAGDKILALTTNYSVAPGPVWIEFTNKAAISGAGDIQGDVPLRGSGQLMAAGTWPLAVVVLPPNAPPDRRPRWGDEAHPPHPPNWQWWPKDARQPMAGTYQAMEKETEEEKQRIEKADQDATQKEEKQKQEYEEQQKEEEQKKQQGGQQQPSQQQPSQQQSSQQKQSKQQATPFAGDEPDEWMSITGMSPEGFPGFPQAIMNQTALPATMGVHSATIDATSSPAEIKIKLIGTGTIPAKSRFLVFSLVGV